ncbi:GNAT family N-acetyltransferase [Pseudoalteromonas tunicata]|jgi:ribosomal-protein-alanine N-acetyltransferase|uniref:Ribosomal-protein-alanine acetyltransferase n=1 Tax=Pseudoalteromonas tunicata D2 TaxID=87626 RepID=A4C5G7_9GAMM|nr:GNAT family N-acetyltransferase [Pseudoalteromonas tunicata]ATC96722.1 hypothetical protein PTUN_b0312 [Pseudoalteromonas tunicata]AXT32885.1 GNAT family N-acetyltransferase [Pseudoalteromonas tunicata]EAR30799.1 ribosomal-protein-alanine acetyltransferase [Pseudoalteromonas tunicata D2]MDP4983769.1 GNAT family N-acetyltransferase [Pseudoalteromonas tunicata]MDP5214664.1 GNAT family N-acetyltransferase [Pseudoalteromonas tunicata]
MTSNIVISPAVKADLPFIYQLDQVSFTGEGYPAFFLRQAFDCWRNHFWVIKQEDDVIAYLLLVPSSETKGDGWILSLAVSEHARGQGLAKQLIQHAIDHATDFQRLLLTVSPDNLAALALYQQFGFTEIEQEYDYFEPGDCRSILGLTL